MYRNKFHLSLLISTKRAGQDALSFCQTSVWLDSLIGSVNHRRNNVAISSLYLLSHTLHSGWNHQECVSSKLNCYAQKSYLSSTLKIKIYLAYFKKTFWGIFQHCVPLSVTLSSQELLLDHGFFGENFKALSNQCALLVLPFFVTGATLNLVVSWHVIAIFFASDARWTQSRIFLLSYQPLANAVVTCGTPAQLVKVTR